MRNLLYVLLFLLVAIGSCAKDKGEINLNSITSDAKLYDFMNAQTYSFYKDSNIPIASVTTSHSGTFLLKFNEKAKAALGTDGKLAVGAFFPDSSLVVKELYNGGATPYAYAVMMKLSTSPFAKQGWLWGEYYPGGSVAYSIKKDGSLCYDCHNGGRDFLQSFDAHP